MVTAAFVSIFRFQNPSVTAHRNAGRMDRIVRDSDGRGLLDSWGGVANAPRLRGGGAFHPGGKSHRARHGWSRFQKISTADVSHPPSYPPQPAIRNAPILDEYVSRPFRR
jgi:hypothetical protein